MELNDRAAAQRDFYVKMSPQLGPAMAQLVGGLPSPGDDSIEAERRDSMTLWLKLWASGALKSIVDASWWMTHYMDRHARLSRTEFTSRSDELVSYASAVIGQLIDNKVLQFVKEPVLPKIVGESFDPVEHTIQQAVLDRLEATMKEQEEGK